MNKNRYDGIFLEILKHTIQNLQKKIEHKCFFNVYIIKKFLKLKGAYHIISDYYIIQSIEIYSTITLYKTIMVILYILSYHAPPLARMKYEEELSNKLLLQIVFELFQYVRFTICKELSFHRKKYNLLTSLSFATGNTIFQRAKVT